MPRSRQTDRVESHILDQALQSFRASALKTDPAIHKHGKSIDAENTILMFGAKNFSEHSTEHAQLHSMLKECKNAKPKPKGVDTRVLDCLHTYRESGAVDLHDITYILHAGLKIYIQKLSKRNHDTSRERRALQQIDTAIERANTVTFANASRKGHGHRSRTIAEMRADNAKLDKQLRTDEERIFRLQEKRKRASHKAGKHENRR
jgi:hypothetical protein